MTRADRRILELLAEASLELPPGVIAHNIEYNRKYVNRRCRKLLELGLLELVDAEKGYYRISETGRAYLSGEIAVDEIEST